jgi:TfoX/Sxy family transcriptional regulator of competence genes
MAYNEDLAERVRSVIGARFDERKMFGGLAFMVNGNMACGILGDELMVRVGKDAHADALSKPHAREMDFTGRSMTGMVYVAPAGLKEKRSLSAWVKRGVSHASSLPPKRSKA